MYKKSHYHNLVVPASGAHSVSFLASACMLLQWSANSAKLIGHFLPSDIAEWQFQKKKSPQILSDVQLLRHFAGTFLVATDQFAVT